MIWIMSMMKSVAWVLLVAGAVALGVRTSTAQDWPQWRGPGRDGTVAGVSAPASWPDRASRDWQATVGLGHASPVVVGDRVFLFAREGEREVLSALSLETGDLLWSEGYPAPYTMNPAARGHGPGPKSTPVVHDGGVYVLGIGGILSRFDASTGHLRWTRSFADQFPATSPTYGAAMSPVVEGEVVIASVGGDDAGALMAFDVETGETRWGWEGDGAGYASPIVVDLGGTRQVVTQSHRSIVGLDAATGSLLWQIPFTTDYDQNIVTPVLHEDTLVFSGLDNGIFGMQVFERGGEWSTETVWKNTDVSMYMSSPVVRGDLLFGLSHKNKGQFFCLDARSGETLWTSEGRQGDNAALLAGGDVLFLLTTGGELIVARAGRQRFEPVGHYQVADTPTWAMPVVLDAREGVQVLVKAESTLALWSLDSD